MGRLSEMLPGGSAAGGEERDGSSEALKSLERSIQLCRGAAAAASAMRRRHPQLAGSAEDLADRLSRRLRPLRDHLDAVVPGTLTSAHEVAPGHADRTGVEELPAEALRELTERLESIHFSMLRVGVNREDPESEGLEAELGALRDFVDEIEPELVRTGEAVTGGDDAATGGRSG